TCTTSRSRTRLEVGMVWNDGNSGLAVQRLTERLGDDDLTVRWHAAIALGCFGEEALAAVPVLLRMLSHGDAADRKMACHALGEIGVAAAVPALCAALTDPHAGVCRAARSALVIGLGRTHVQTNDPW